MYVLRTGNFTGTNLVTTQSLTIKFCRKYYTGSKAYCTFTDFNITVAKRDVASGKYILHMTENDAELKPVLFNRIAIITFSFFLSTLFGGILYAQNLWSTDNRRSIAPIMLFCLAWNLVIMQLVSKYTSNSLLTFILPNIVGGILLAFPFWNYHFKDVTSYVNKKVWGPLLIVLILYGIIIVGNILKK